MCGIDVGKRAPKMVTVRSRISNIANIMRFWCMPPHPAPCWRPARNQQGRRGGYVSDCGPAPVSQCRERQPCRRAGAVSDLWPCRMRWWRSRSAVRLLAVLCATAGCVAGVQIERDGSGDEPTTTPPRNCSGLGAPRDCSELPDTAEDGEHELWPDNCSQSPVRAYCHNATDGGQKWTVIQRRQGPGKVKFNRNWVAYRDGFGDLTGEHWLGLENMYLLTSFTGRYFDLRVDMEDFLGKTAYALYRYFQISSAGDGYKLLNASFVGGPARDCLKMYIGSKFSTYDNDNDLWTNNNCARIRKGGWWYYECGDANLNGVYRNFRALGPDGIWWRLWKYQRESLRKVQILIRPGPPPPPPPPPPPSPPPRNCSGLGAPRDCSELPDTAEDGEHELWPDNCSQSPVRAYCHNATDGGQKWTVIQRRQGPGKVKFNRNWVAYRDGFGDLTGEHWLGLENMYLLTSFTGRYFDLRVDMEDFLGKTAYALYRYFQISSAGDGYKLLNASFVGGPARDGLKMYIGSKFSTYDNDSDNWTNNNCARIRKGGWWYYECGDANLNGVYRNFRALGSDGIWWRLWKYRRESLRKVQILIRPGPPPPPPPSPLSPPSLLSTLPPPPLG